MKSFLKELMRPTLLSIISGVIIMMTVFLLVIPLMACFPIFYQEDEYFLPAYSINFETDPERQTIFLIGGSRYKEVAVTAKPITKLLREKTHSDIVYANLAVTALSYSEAIVLMNQSHYKKGSIALIGTDINALSRGSKNNQGFLKRFRLGFAHYNDMLPLLRTLGVKVDGGVYGLNAYRYMLKGMASTFSFKTLLTQSWMEANFSYRRPSNFGFANSEHMVKSVERYIRARIDGYKETEVLQAEQLLLALIKVAQDKGYKVVLFEAPYSPKAKELNQVHNAYYEKILQDVMRKTGVTMIRANDNFLGEHDFLGLVHLNQFGRMKYEPVFIDQLASAINQESA